MYTERFAVYTRLLREMREEAGLTQRELAERLTTDQTRISCYERGQRRMDIVELENYCAALDVTLAEFIRRYSKSEQE